MSQECATAGCLWRSRKRPERQLRPVLGHPPVPSTILHRDRFGFAIDRTVATAPPNSITVEVGPAAALPFPAARFDVILSVFGIQFEPNPDAVIDEIARVAKPGAMLGIALWNTDSPLGSFLRLLDHFVPPSTEMQELRAWGVAGEVERRLAGHFGELEFRFGNAPLYADSLAAGIRAAR